MDQAQQLPRVYHELLATTVTSYSSKAPNPYATRHLSRQVCITSYQLAVQDNSSFRRKRFYCMILDEARRAAERRAGSRHMSPPFL
jgi:SNF2 family DNA or RNA helicase